MSMHRVDDEHANFLQKTAENVKKATGQPTGPQSLNPNDETLLKDIEDKVSGMLRVAGNTAEEKFGSANSQINDVASEGKLPISIDSLRRKLKEAA